MTAASPPPDDDLPRDPAFDDAWRALSAEEPPAAIDAALRAAARREVDAGPRIAVPDRIAAPRAAKPVNWWRPLAVAATLGAIAVGLVQLIAPERIGAPGHDAGVVSDMPPLEPVGRARSAKKEAPEETSGSAPTAEEKAGFPPATTARGGDRKDAPLSASESPAPAEGGVARKGLQSRDAASAFPQAATADGLARQDARKDGALERQRDTNADVAPVKSAAKLEAPGNAPAPARTAEGPAPPAPAVAPMRAAEAFPAERANRGDATIKREAAPEESGARAAAAAGGAAPVPVEGTAEKSVTSTATTDNRTAPLAKFKAVPDMNERGAALAGGASARRAQDAQAMAAGTAPLQAATPAGNVEARGGTHPALAVPDWIALIRRFIAENNFAAAERELAAFRAAHTDAQQLLPPDLREWKPPR